jgi:hypothetical protein
MDFVANQLVKLFGAHFFSIFTLHRSTGRAARLMDIVTDQLVGLLAAHFYSMLTSPPTSWLGCSVLNSLPTSWSDCSPLHRQLRWGSPAKLGTPRRSNSSCKLCQLSWRLPWQSDLATSHRCAINLLHTVRIRVLILGSSSRVLIRACQMTLASFLIYFL